MLRSSELAVALAVLSIASPQTNAEIYVSPEHKFLPANEAFVATLETMGVDVKLTVDVADGYQVYRDKFSLTSKTDGVDVMFDSFPAAEIKEYPSIGQSMAIYESKVTLDLFSTAQSGEEVIFELKYQGCAESGMCYPPQTKEFNFIVP